MARAEDHIRELLKLPAEERANAAKLLLDSLDEDGDDPEAESLKLAELVRRADAVHDGTAELFDATEVRRRVMARLRDIRGECAFNAIKFRGPRS
jgi:putative addiction module component (TIGR02574 family)